MIESSVEVGNTCNLCGTAVAPDQPPRWRKHGFDIFGCRSCSLLFRGNPPSTQDLLDIYDGGYFRRDERTDADGYADYLREEIGHRRTAKRRAERLTRLRSPGRLLDVGAAAGFFMDEARKMGWNVQGIDVSADMTRVANERLALAIATGAFQDADYPAGEFDAVTMWDYIEHSIDPGSDLAKAAELLRSGGLLMLSTGDAGSAVARACGRSWHLLTPRHHNFFFTQKTLESYLRTTGFEPIYVGRPGAYYSLRYLFYKLQTMAPDSGLVRSLGERAAASSVGKRVLYFNLRDIVTIYARRL